MKKILTAAVLSVLAMNAYAAGQLQGANGNADVAKVEKANAGLTTMQCPFVRTTKVAALKDAAKEEGTFVFESPEKLSMRYKSGELFVVSQDNVSMGSGNRVRTVKTTNRNVGELAATLIACVRGKLQQIAGKFAGVKTVGHNLQFTIKTDLNVGRNRVTKVELAYAKSDLSLVSLNLVEEDGSYTLYELKEKKMGSAVDQKAFEVADRRAKGRR